ncbi:hypothetical protein ACIBCA_04035 [Kitasatospora sp. NPDC051170]|uniref:hypothetical protein n=1 Tax=Kitasatospora sp. NPDC051170 TaxID=3364056 RepID=UPI0037B29F21
MLPRTVRGAVAAAAVVVEEVGRRVTATAATVLERTGVDVAEVERRFGGQFPPSAEQLQTLAGEAFTAGRAGVDLAVGVARGEVEKVFEKVGDQVTKVGVVLAYLESKLREVEGEEAAQPAPDPYATEAPAPRADDLFGRGWEERADEPVLAERVEVDEPVEVDPPVPPVAPVVPVRKAAAKKVAVERTAAQKTTAKKTTAKKTTAKKTTASKATVKQPTVKKAAAAKKTAVKKTTVRKATSRKQPDGE